MTLEAERKEQAKWGASSLATHYLCIVLFIRKLPNIYERHFICSFIHFERVFFSCFFFSSFVNFIAVVAGCDSSLGLNGARILPFNTIDFAHAHRTRQSRCYAIEWIFLMLKANDVNQRTHYHKRRIVYSICWILNSLWRWRRRQHRRRCKWHFASCSSSSFPFFCLPACHSMMMMMMWVCVLMLLLVRFLAFNIRRHFYFQCIHTHRVPSRALAWPMGEKCCVLSVWFVGKYVVSVICLHSSGGGDGDRGGDRANDINVDFYPHYFAHCVSISVLFLIMCDLTITFKSTPKTESSTNITWKWISIS